MYICENKGHEYIISMNDNINSLPKVLFDSQAFDMQTHGGVSRYVSELISHLQGKVIPILELSESSNIYARNMNMVADKDTYKEFCHRYRIPFKRIVFKIIYNIRHGHYANWDMMPKFNIFNAEKLLKQGDFDLFHPTFFDPYFLKYIKAKPYVVTVHDMIVEKYPEYFQSVKKQIRQKRLVVTNASHIIAVSQCTKNDLRAIYGIPSERITVIHHGVDATPCQYSQTRKYDFPYILYVGDRAGGYKRFVDFVRALSSVLCKCPDLRLVCVGRSFTKREQDLFSQLNIQDKVESTFADTDQKMADLYHYAKAFVYPSEYEGFGLPILEAFKYECPVVLNNASCFPEIAGDAALYFEFGTTESQGLSHMLETILSWTPEERAKHLMLQRQRLSIYSWEKSARQHAEVYNNVIRDTFKLSK